MNWLTGYENRTERDAPIGRLTWFRIGGRARYLVRPSDGEDLARLLGRAHENGVLRRVLGGGANVLVKDDGVDGVVVRLDQPAFREVRIEGERVRVGAGVELMSFARSLSYEGLSGLEGLAGIPGTVGGAIRMNAGGRFGDFGDVVGTIDVVAPDGTTETWPRERIGFGYRTSNVGEHVVLSVALELTRQDPTVTRLRYDQRLAHKTKTQPLKENSAGCIFKNPPQAPAGKLIDDAGGKGARCGEAFVSPRHANFIVAGRGATASDVMHLIDRIRDLVYERFGVRLEPEIDIW